MAITPTAEWLRNAIGSFVADDPILSELLARINHSQSPIGFSSCRKKTSGSGNWSDHSWGNALDVMRLTKWKDANDPDKGIAQSGSPHYLDTIHV